MSPDNFKPATFASTDVGTASGAGLHSHIGIESQLTGTGDIGAAHQFFNPGRMVGNIAPIGNAAIAAPIVPGAEAAMMPIIPGANEPISPLIQLIMRMPGATGLVNSFFECIGAFFLPQLHMLGLDTILSDLHAHVASLASHLPGGGHFSLDLHLGPDGLPNLEDGGGAADLLGVHKSVGGMLKSSEGGMSFRDAIKVSGGPDLNSPRFEGLGDQAKPGELLSGPSMSESPIGNQLASGQRIFTDRFQGTLFTKPGMHGSLLAGSAGSTTATVTNAASNTAINVSGNNFAPQGFAQSAAGNISDATGGAAPAGGLFDGASFGKNGLGADNNLLATNPADSFRPSAGGQSADFNSSYLNHPAGDAASHAHTAHTAPEATNSNAPHGSLLKPGLKAKELSLESVSKTTAQTAHKIASPANTATPASVAKTAAQPAAPAAKSAPQVEANHKVAEVVAKPAAHHAPAADKAVAKEVVKAPTKIASSKPFHNIDGVDSIAKPDSQNAFSRVETQTTQPKFETAAPKPVAKLDLNKTMAKMSETKLTDSALTPDLKPGTYTIRSGDCLWNIAKDQLGSSLKWQDIYKLNQDVLGSNPQMLHTGVTLKMPGMPGGSPNIASAATEATKYVVKPGDCLWNIAKDQLHDASKWGDLFKANTDIIGSNARMIMPGQELTIPGTGDGALVASVGGVPTDGALGQISDAGTSTSMSSMEPSSQFGSPATADGYSQVAPSQSFETQPLTQQPTVQAPAVQHQVMQQPAVQVPQTPAPVPVHTTPSAFPNPLQRIIPTMQGPGAAIPAPSVHVGGPGSASAATLGSAPSLRSSGLADIEAVQPVVKSSLGTDIASFLSTRR